MTAQASKQASPKNAKAPPAPPPFPEGKPTKLGQTTITLSKGKTTSLRLVRVIKAPAERIYQAFLDPDAMAKWLPPHGFTGHVHSIDARVGGSYRMSFSTINRSWGHTFGGTYKELVPGKRIVHTDNFETDDPVMGGANMLVTIDLKPVPGGTEVHILQE
ncbi:MAG: SRPBCC domain-containing protein, partial [Thermoplasmatota archaeon]